MEFSEKLILLRRARGMTQTDMADLLGVTRQSVYKWERGVSYPEAMTLLAMREVFGVTLDALLDPAYVIRMAKDPAPEVRRVGEDFVPSSDFVAEKNGNAPEKPGTTSLKNESVNDAKIASDEPKQVQEAATEKTEKKKKRGFFARLFG